MFRKTVGKVVAKLQSIVTDLEVVIEQNAGYKSKATDQIAELELDVETYDNEIDRATRVKERLEALLS